MREVAALRLIRQTVRVKINAIGVTIQHTSSRSGHEVLTTIVHIY
eukprot:COSAG06_NODE_617_length_13753_cov_134.082241_7_plen_45_part_00